MSVLIQISDPHFGTEQPPVVDALLELVRRLRPGIAVLSGDLTQRARRAQFAAARRFADQLEVDRVVTIPGNHDIPLFNIAARAFAPFANYRRAFGEDLEPEVDSEGFFVACVNAARPARHKDGELSEAQIERVAQRLRDVDQNRLRLVVVHQPVLAIRGSDIHNLVHGHERAVRRWCAAGVDVIMGGHIHLPYVRELAEQYPDLPRRAWGVQAGTAVSRRIRERIPNSVNVLRHGSAEPMCTLERWDFDARSGAFASVRTDHLLLDRRSVSQAMTAAPSRGEPSL